MFDYIRLLAYDGIGTLFAATHPSVTASRGIGDFAVAHGGQGRASLIGRAVKTDSLTAALANGTLGFAADFEPHHSEAILHPIAVIVPTRLGSARRRIAPRPTFSRPSRLDAKSPTASPWQ